MPGRRYAPEFWRKGTAPFFFYLESFHPLNGRFYFLPFFFFLSDVSTVAAASFRDC